MPRKPRFKLAGMPVHVVQRGNNRQAVFYDDRTTAPISAGWKREQSAMAVPSTPMCS